MKKIKITLLLSLMLFPLVSSAAWLDWSNVHLIYVASNQKVHLTLKPDFKHNNPDACTSRSYLVLLPENKAYKEIYQMALTAKASGSLFRVSVSGCTGVYPKVNNAMMQ